MSRGARHETDMRKTLVDKGLAAAVIARLMGHLFKARTYTRNGIIGKCHRMNWTLTGAPGRPKGTPANCSLGQ